VGNVRRWRTSFEGLGENRAERIRGAAGVLAARLSSCGVTGATAGGEGGVGGRAEGRVGIGGGLGMSQGVGRGLSDDRTTRTRGSERGPGAEVPRSGPAAGAKRRSTEGCPTGPLREKTTSFPSPPRSPSFLVSPGFLVSLVPLVPLVP